MNSLFLEYETFIYKLQEVSGFIDNVSKKSDVYDKILELSIDKDIVSKINYLKNLPNLTVQYNAIIISLYGAFENYIDSITKAYLDLIFSNENKIGKMCPNIRDRYKSKLGEFLTNPNRFPMDLVEEKEIESYSKFVDKKYVEANKDFIISHPSNMHISVLRELLKTIGVDDFNRIYSYDNVKSYFLNYMDEKEYAKKKSRNDSLFDDYEKFIESRNLVAHGKEISDRISVNEIITKIIPLLEAISMGVLEMCVESYVKAILDEYKIEKSLIKVYNDNICCFNCADVSFKEKDILFIKNEDRINFVTIESIEIEHKRIPEIKSLNVNVGIKINGKINSNSKLVFLKNLNY